MFFPPFSPEDAGSRDLNQFVREQFGKLLGNHVNTLPERAGEPHIQSRPRRANHAKRAA